MEINNMTISTGISAWAGSGMCSSPKPQHQGTGAPFAGYAQAHAALVVVPTPVRTADAKVPDPRGRKR